MANKRVLYQLIVTIFFRLLRNGSTQTMTFFSVN